MLLCPGFMCINELSGQTAIGMAVDCYDRYFYWTDITGKTISKAQLDGKDSQVIVSGMYHFKLLKPELPPCANLDCQGKQIDPKQNVCCKPQ